MPVVTLPDGSDRSYDHPVTVADIAADIGPGLAKAALAGKVDAVIMGPTSKHAQNLAGYKFAGFRETANHFAGCDDTVLITLGKNYNLTRVTTHVPLADVPRAITRERVQGALRVLDHDLRSRFGIARPRILVTGLNPHAGEGGHLGTEDAEVIAPVVAEFIQ